MSRAFFYRLLVSVALSSAFLLAKPAQAATPTVAATLVSGDTVQLTVIGDPNAGVILNYLGTGSTVKLSALGTTNAAGTFSASVSTGVFGIVSGSLFNVSVNNQRSDSLVWPYGAAPNTTANAGIVLGQTAITLGAGQSTTVIVGNTTGNALYIANNTAPTVASFVVANNQLTIFGLNAGATSFQICSAISVSTCAVGVVTVTNASVVSVTNNTALSFSQTNPALSPGQVMPITISGGSGNYTLTANANSAAVQANVVGNTLTLYGNSNGSSVLTVCASNGSCGTLSVTVAAPGTMPLTLSQTNVALSVGQSSLVAISGAGGFTITNMSNASVANVVLSGTALSITASAPGTNVVTICQAGGGCALLTVVVSSGSLPIVATPTSLAVTSLISVGQEIKFSFAGGNGIYVVSSNPGTPFSAVLANNVLVIQGTAPGTASVTVCSAGTCNSMTITVTAAVPAISSLPTPAISTVTPAATFRFATAIVPGDRTANVTQLQKRLYSEGIFKGEITGFFGAATLEAVKKYQTLHGLNPIGTVGPSTRAALNGA